MEQKIVAQLGATRFVLAFSNTVYLTVFSCKMIVFLEHILQTTLY